MAEPVSHRQPADPIASTSRRFVFALALLPIVPAVSGIGVSTIMELSGGFVIPGLASANMDELRWFHLLFAIFWVTGTISIWRGLVIWTLGRKWLTSLVALIPFIQVIYAKPLWASSGCMSAEIFRAGQFQLGAGIFVWMAVWVWWGTERWSGMRVEQSKSVEQSVRLLVPQLVAGIGLQPVVFGIFLIIVEWIDGFIVQPSDLPGTLALAAAATVGVPTWLCIWYRQIAWRPRIAWRTSGLALICIVLPLMAQALLVTGASGLLELVLWLAPVIGWGAFMAGTIALWPLREGVMHGDGPCCLKCGYSLRGLKATRCPECGDEATLDQLWGAIESP